MDWSDDCAYSVHDLEDAIFSGNVKTTDFQNDFETLYQVMTVGYRSEATKEEAAAALTRLEALSCWPHYYDGSHRSLARLKDSTSQLIGRFVQSAEHETRRVYGDAPLSRYAANLEIPREQKIEVDLLKAVAAHYLINAAASQERYAKQRVVIKELVEMLFAKAPREIDSLFNKAWERADDENSRMRVVIDQVSNLTDPGAYALHARLSSLG
jgi:dGTPase